ncbi:MAG: AI-2E family transporter [Alicyclobacillus sp.]|nr:AI-2E family transporter [Alicyclobacillus sp.]
MDKTTRYLKTALAVLVTLACLYTVGLLRGFLQDVWHVVYVVLLPFLISVVICYILQPVVELLVRRRVPRGMAILLIYIVFILALVVAVLQAIPAVTRQFTQLADHVPTLLQQANGWLDGLSRHTKYLPDAARQGIETSLARLEQSVAGFIAGMFSMLSNTLNALFVAFVIPFIVFYMLKDADAIGRGVLRLTPHRFRRHMKVILISIDTTLGSYVRGQLLVMLVVFVLTYAGFLIVRLPYALLLALFLGLVDIIPYIGPILGAAPAIILGLSISPQMALKVLLVNLIVQQLEGNLISPQIMGRSLHLHPMAVVAALLIGGELGGIVGLLCAVPLLALGKVTYTNLKKMRHSEP